LYLRQVVFFTLADGCTVFDDSGDVVDVVFGNVAVVATGADVGVSGADIGWYLLKVENINLVVESREFVGVGSLCISVQ
jgi:hypothetical protein